MRRRTLLTAGALATAHGLLAGSPRAMEHGPECRRWFSNWPEDQPCPGPVLVSTGGHQIGISDFLRFSNEEILELMQREPPIVLGSGPIDAISAAAWEVKPLFYEDIVVWTKADSGLQSVSSHELRQRVIEGRNILFNTERIKLAPILNWLQSRGFRLPVDGEELSGLGMGAPGYDALRDLAQGHDDALVIGLRAHSAEGFRPVAIDGHLPITSNYYPLRKAYLAYYQDEDVAARVWTDIVNYGIRSAMDADKEIFQEMGLDGDVVDEMSAKLAEW